MNQTSSRLGRIEDLGEGRRGSRTDWRMQFALDQGPERSRVLATGRRGLESPHQGLEFSAAHLGPLAGNRLLGPFLADPSNLNMVENLQLVAFVAQGNRSALRHDKIRAIGNEIVGRAIGQPDPERHERLLSPQFAEIVNNHEGILSSARMTIKSKAQWRKLAARSGGHRCAFALRAFQRHLEDLERVDDVKLAAGIHQGDDAIRSQDQVAWFADEMVGEAIHQLDDEGPKRRGIPQRANLIR